MASSFESDEQISIDLTSTLGHPQTCNHTRDSEVFISGSFWFPPCFQGNSKEVRRALTAHLFKPCQTAGFSLIIGSVDKNPQQSGLIRVRFLCSRGVMHKANKSSQGLRKTKTSKEPSIPHPGVHSSFPFFITPRLAAGSFPSNRVGVLVTSVTAGCWHRRCMSGSQWWMLLNWN